MKTKKRGHNIQLRRHSVGAVVAPTALILAFESDRPLHRIAPESTSIRMPPLALFARQPAISFVSPRAVTYYLRIADYHTYFVGSRWWEFSVWAHNANGGCFRWSNLFGRDFTNWLGSLAKQASHFPKNPLAGRLTMEETQAILEQLLKDGWKLRGGVDTKWVGGLHINLIGPSGQRLHLPLPPGFRL
jgi:hypothetical protein